MIVEQVGSQHYRMMYIPESGTFVETAHEYLGHARGFEVRRLLEALVIARPACNDEALLMATEN